MSQPKLYKSTPIEIYFYSFCEKNQETLLHGSKSIFSIFSGVTSRIYPGPAAIKNNLLSNTQYTVQKQDT